MLCIIKAMKIYIYCSRRTKKYVSQKGKSNPERMILTVHGFFLRSNIFQDGGKAKDLTEEQLLEREILRVREVKFLSSQKEQFELFSAILSGTRSGQLKKIAQVSRLIKALFISLQIKIRKITKKTYYVKKSVYG